MKKLITITQENIIICDNPICNFVIPIETGNPNDYNIESFIDYPCPICSSNLLTRKDYEESRKVLAVFNWINKWFSWIMYIPTPFLIIFSLFKKKSHVDVTFYYHRGKVQKEKPTKK